MSLPDGFLDELRTRLSIAQVVGRKVTWDAQRSNQGKGDFWAPCPFHEEKTASFHVDERKGFYYCFGCHAKGDAIAFVRESENVGFMDAVEILARETGMVVPDPDPRAKAKADRRGALVEVMAEAVRHYRLQLKTAAAGPAREYLAGRGLGPDALERWEIGFAPDRRRGIVEALTTRGIDEALVIAAGLAALPEDGGPAYDRFRGRIVFPIRDPQGRAIALGGRALDPGARAKYLNSPQTDIFDKGRCLFNYGPAREATSRGEALVVAEGYMDVIALAEAGLRGAVAPLGTAITEDQLQLIWRAAPEAVIALDGDPSGLKAAMRVVDLALPMIETGRSLRFAILPPGMDPDDVIRSRGVTAMRKLVEGATSMVELLWRRETADREFDSPERRAALDAALAKAVRRIGDARLRRHYVDELKRRRAELFGSKRRPAVRGGGALPQRRGRPAGQEMPGRFGQASETAARGSLLVRAGESVTAEMREDVVLAALLLHPDLMQRFAGELERLAMSGRNDELKTALLGRGAEMQDMAGRAAQEVGAAALERVRGASHVRLSLGSGDDPERAALCVAEQLALLSAQGGARQELQEALEGRGDLDENVVWRIAQAARSLSARRQTGVDAEYEIAENGAEVPREERARSRAFYESIEFHRKGRKAP